MWVALKRAVLGVVTERDLSTFSADMTGQLDVFGHDGHLLAWMAHLWLEAPKLLEEEETSFCLGLLCLCLRILC